MDEVYSDPLLKLKWQSPAFIRYLKVQKNYLKKYLRYQKQKYYLCWNAHLLYIILLDYSYWCIIMFIILMLQLVTREIICALCAGVYLHCLDDHMFEFNNFSYRWLACEFHTKD